MVRAGGGVGGEPAPRRSGERHPVVVCSLERRGPVRRRIQLLVDELLSIDPAMEVLYVEPALDVVHALAAGEARTVLASLRDREVTEDAVGSPRLRVIRPRKWLPRVLDGRADERLARQVVQAARWWSMEEPLLWINDAHYAPLLDMVGWPSLYDVTDDWLHSSMTPREARRLEAADRLLVDRCDAVVVCSPDLARTRGSHRHVELVPNAVDVELFRRAQPRPRDLPSGDVVLYAGTLHEDRLDVDLCAELSDALPGVALVLLGPDSLQASSRARLMSRPNVHLLGPRPYADVPAYLQHADVVVVPHVVTPFTESLDPIKYYECLAVGRPTVATPVAGFRDAGWPIVTADRSEYVEAVRAALGAQRGGPGSDAQGVGGADGVERPRAVDVPTWRQRAVDFSAVVGSVTGW